MGETCLQSFSHKILQYSYHGFCLLPLVPRSNWETHSSYLKYPGSCSCSLSGEIVFPSGHGLCAVPGCVTSGFIEVQRVQEYMGSLLNQVVYCNKDEEYALVKLLVWSISKFISTVHHCQKSEMMIEQDCTEVQGGRSWSDFNLEAATWCQSTS